MIRNYRPEDLQRLQDIGDRAWKPIWDMYTATLGEKLYRKFNPDFEHCKTRQITAHAETHPDWLFVCEENDQVIGFICFFLDDTRKIGLIGNNAADPECGVKGVGQQMYQAVFQHMREHGMEAVQVTTGADPAHAPARRAYERAGFQLRCESVTYYMEF